MIINSGNAGIVRENALRLANCITSKEDLADLATAGSFSQFFSAVETLLTNTDMYFDDELLNLIDETQWQSFKASLMVFTLNIVNRKANKHHHDSIRAHQENGLGREFQGAFLS